MALNRSTQPIVKDASGVLVGVAQIRVGRPSNRDAGTAVNASAFIPVGKSKKVMGTSYNTVCIVTPNTVWSANSGSVSTVAVPSTTITGSYTGKLDGNLIVRACATATVGSVAEASSTTAADRIEIFDVYGKLTYTSTALAVGTPTCSVYGLSLAGNFAGAQVGDTWVLPVWTGSAIALNQTGIVSPFSMFYDASDSVGGLKSASFQPKIDSVKKLQSGFPSYTADQIIDSVSVDVSWSGYEYTNSKLALLKQMISRVINTGELSAISVEMVMRTRGNSLIRMFIPSCTFTSLPTYAPTNDYSDVAFAMSALKQTEFSAITTAMGIDSLSTGDLAIYNGWLADAPIYEELPY